MGLAVYPWQEDLARELNDARANLPNGLLSTVPKASARLTSSLRLHKVFFVSIRPRTARPAGSVRDAKWLKRARTRTCVM